MAQIKCLDTYALVEIANENEKFVKYLNEEIIINDLTLTEFYGVLLREEGENIANYWLKKLKVYSKEVELDILIEAIRFRQEHKKQNISFFDAVGYIFSIKNGAFFVTGDKEFENFVNVEFKKK